MVQRPSVKAYKLKQMTEEVREKLQKSVDEAENLQERKICCQYCDYYLLSGFEDLSGHVQVKCPNCKAISVLNLGYFCRRKHRRRIYSR